jgi:hypothetical protein
LRKLAKIPLIVIIGTVVVWAGLHIGPSSQRVDAKVFDTLQSFAKGMPSYLFDRNQSDKPRKIKVNGIQTYLTAQQSDDEVSDILDFYAEQYESLQLDPKMLAVVEKLEGNPRTEKIVQGYEVLECMRKHRPFRYQNENFGFWGTFEFQNKSLELSEPEYLERFNKALESGQLGTIGIFRVTLALKRGQGGGSRIINIWTDEDFNLNQLHPDATGDMPGEDIENVPRFAGAWRQLSVQQQNLHTLDRLVVYASKGSVLNHVLYYHSMMAGQGWTTDNVYDEAMKAESRNNIMFYRRKGRESMISIEQDHSNGNIITTIMDRKTLGDA